MIGDISVNILFTASTFDHIVRFHLRYIKELSERGHRVYVIGGGVPTQIPYAVESIFIPFEKRIVSVRDLAISKQIRQIVEEKHIDRIITHTTLASFYVRLAVMGMRKRPFVVCVVHGYLFDKHTNRLKYDVYLAAEKYVARVTDVLLTMNQWDYETAKRHRLGREVKKIPGMGVDFTSLRYTHTKPEIRQILNEQYGIPENACLLLYGAEFSKRKNQKLLIDVMKALPENVYAIMAGDGELIGECRQYAAQDFICLDHYALIMGNVSKKNMDKKALPDFYAATNKLAHGYMDTLYDDVTHFTTMFDYRNAGGDYKNSKDAIERSIRFLTSYPVDENLK